jgi:NADH dehydrogenase FAD-containing subunit
LIENGSGIVASFSPNLSTAVHHPPEKLGVEVRWAKAATRPATPLGTATIGGQQAVADLDLSTLSGRFAWLLWPFAARSVPPPSAPRHHEQCQTGGLGSHHEECDGNCAGFAAS